MISLQQSPDGFSILHNGTLLIQHTSADPFIYLGRGAERIDMYRGNFEIEDRILARHPLPQWQLWPENFEEGKAYSLAFSDAGGNSVVCHFEESDGRLRCRLESDQARTANRFWFRLPAQPSETVYGGGEQFSHFNLRGRRFPLWSSEQGVGRNKRTPITFQADVEDRCGGDYWWTFFPQPTFVSSRRYYLHADCNAYAAFDFRDELYHELEFWALPDSFTLGTAGSMLELVQDIGRLLGQQPELPDWVHDGVILGIQGGTEVCAAKLAKAKAHGVPVNGIWAQDWEGIRMTSFGQRLMWNWQWDPERYPELPAAIKRWKAEGIRFLGYANPYVAAEKALFKEAAAKGYLAKNADGQDYLVDFGEFDAGIPDLTNPAAYDWYKSVIRRNLVDFGLGGWMADFGEYLPTDTVLHDGTPAMIAHNAWPALWARVNYEAVAEAGLLHEVTFFMRAGYTGSQKYCPLMWAGDQNVDWSEDDGLLSVIPAALSLAMCGHGLHHSDIGGYTTLYGMKRSKELFLRWAEFAAFTAMMRGHEGNRPKDNWQFDSDDETLDSLARLGQLFVALKPYRKAGVKECAAQAIPLMRPLFLHYENEAEAWLLKDEYLLGRDLLVAPVYREGTTSREVWLPRDDWRHLWTGQAYGGGRQPVTATLGLPPVFYRKASGWAGLFETIGKQFGDKA